jgi:Phage regulatory protein Rha (Phage_pRha)
LNQQLAFAGYTEAKGELRPMYQVTRDGFTFLAIGFTGKRAAEFKEKVIAAFDAMEQALLDGTGERRQVDVNMHHQRGITNSKGRESLIILLPPKYIPCIKNQPFFFAPGRIPSKLGALFLCKGLGINKVFQIALILRSDLFDLKSNRHRNSRSISRTI